MYSVSTTVHLVRKIFYDIKINQPDNIMVRHVKTMLINKRTNYRYKTTPFIFIQSSSITVPSSRLTGHNIITKATQCGLEQCYATLSVLATVPQCGLEQCCKWQFCLHRTGLVGESGATYRGIVRLIGNTVSKC